MIKYWTLKDLQPIIPEKLELEFELTNKFYVYMFVDNFWLQ